MSSDKPSPPKVTIHCAEITQDDWVQVVGYTETAKLSRLTEIELTLVTPSFAVMQARLLGSHIEICIETPHMDLLLNRASDFSGIEVEESRHGQSVNCRSVFGTVTEVVETTVNPSDKSALGYYGDPDVAPQHDVLFLYRLSVRPRLSALGQRSRLRVLTDISVPDIIESVLKGGGFLSEKDYKFCLSQSYPKRRFTIQYNETDLAFISRLAEHWGIGFFFEHHNGCDVVVFTDGDQRWEGGQVPVLPFTSTGEKLGLVDLSVRHAQVPGHYILRDYNPEHPTVDWTRSGSLSNGDDGEIIEYCSNFDSMEEGTLLLRARLDALSASRTAFSGQVAEAILEVGTTVQITGHPAFDRKMLSLISVELEWKSPAFSGDAPAEFTQRFEAVVTGLNVRPERRTPTPRIDGVVLGMIEEEKDQEYAELDKDGGYRVRLVVDDPETNPQPYAGVRMMQPHAGQGYGFHFPQRPGTEVALSFIDGNPDRPVINGTIPNPLNSSPVQSTTAKSNVIRTGGGNEINFQDSKGNERIKLTSPHGNSLIQIGSPNFPNSGITLDTLGASAERAGVGKSLLTPVLDTTTQLNKSLGRKQTLTSTTDEFAHDWKSLLDTPARVGDAFETVNAVARQMVDIQENIRGTGKARIEQLEIRISQLDYERKNLSGKLTSYEILRQNAWKKYALEPAGFVTEKIKELYDDYFKKEANFREAVFYYWDAQSTTSSEVSRQETQEFLNIATEARKELYDAIKNDRRYVDLLAALDKENEYGYNSKKSSISKNSESHLTVSQQLINVTHKENLTKIEKELEEAQYNINTGNVLSLDFARRKRETVIGVAASVGEILQTMTMLEALADQRGANVRWNIAPGPRYAPGLLALATGIPPLLEETPLLGAPEGGETQSYLSDATKNLILHEFNSRNFVQGWNTAQTEVSSEHALTLSSELRMLQSAKIIAINAWCKETEYLDPAKGLWEKFKSKMKMEGKAAKVLKMAGSVASAPNFLLGFLASPITSAVSALGGITDLFRKNVIPETPGSPGGTLLMRGENRALLISDRHIEIGAPVVDITSGTTRSFADNDHLMMAGRKARAEYWTIKDANAVFQMAANGNVMMWANNKIELSHAPTKLNVRLKDSKKPTDSNELDLLAEILTNDTDNNKMKIDDSGIAFKFNRRSNFQFESLGVNFSCGSNNGFNFVARTTKASISEDGIIFKAAEGGKIKFSVGKNSISIDNNGIKINGQELRIGSTSSLTLKAAANVAIKGMQVDVQGSAKTDIGSAGAPTIIKGATIMLG